MTVGVAINCKDGIVIASDSLATFSRGAPVARHTNKVYVVEHKKLASPIVLVGAGMTAFIDKFIDRTKRIGIDEAARKLGDDKKLDVVDFVERVAEPVVAFLLKEYLIDRNRFFGSSVSDYSLAMLIAGVTSPTEGDQKPELRTYNVHYMGLAERIDGYGTIGSGAAYAEFLLHFFTPDPEKLSVNEAVKLICYTIKGVEIMDPNVGGDTRVCCLQMKNGRLDVSQCGGAELPRKAREKMDLVLKEIGKDMQTIVGKNKKKS